MHITNTNTGNSTKPRVQQQNSNYAIINRYSRNSIQSSHSTASKQHNPNNLLYEIPEQYNTSRNNSNSTTSSRSNSKRYKLKANNHNQNEGLFKNNYQISFNSDRKKNSEEYIPTSNLNPLKRNGSKASMSPGTPLQNPLSRGSIANSDENSTLVNSTKSKLKADYASTKSLLDLVSEYEDKSDDLEDTLDTNTNLNKQLRINQKLSIMKQNVEKKSTILKGITNPESYFYSDVKFINDEINHQYKNMKQLRTQDLLNPESKKMFKKKMLVSEKYLDIVVKNELKDNDDKKIFIEQNDDFVSKDFLEKLAEDAWMKAEASTNFTQK